MGTGSSDNPKVNENFFMSIVYLVKDVNDWDYSGFSC